MGAVVIALGAIYSCSGSSGGTAGSGGNASNNGNGGSSNGNGGSSSTGAGGLVVPDNPTVECTTSDCYAECRNQPDCVLVCQDSCTFEVTSSAPDAQVYCVDACYGDCDGDVGCDVTCLGDCEINCNGGDCTVLCGEEQATVCADGTRVCGQNCPADQGSPDAGGGNPKPVPEGCYQAYLLQSDVTCEPESSMSCNQATRVTGACSDGRVFETVCSGDTPSGCSCTCQLQGGDTFGTCTLSPSCFGNDVCQPEACGDVDGAPLLECCSDADCIAGIPHCRDGNCSSNPNAGVATTSCDAPDPVDPCASVSCGPGHTCVDGNCFCGKNEPCGRAETCVDEVCYCGDNPACGAGLTCFDGACQ
jgi:hypothetical protein